MVKFNTGSWISNYKETKSIVIEEKFPIKDFAIGSSIIAAGVGYLIVKAFKFGARGFEMAELKTLESLDLLGDSEEDK